LLRLDELQNVSLASSEHLNMSLPINR
jgi:hypothetical protein